jgi:branched-chain amino acid transport system permease protein
MTDSKSKIQNPKSKIVTWTLVVAALVLFPFIVQLITGQPVDAGTPKFWQGMMAQVFILAVYAVSYDLLMGYTGILSFGHAMFFGGGAYTSAILLTRVGWDFWVVLLAVIGVAIAQGILIGVLSLRVHGVYLTMVTLAFAQMFYIMVKASDFTKWTGAEDGVTNIPIPEWLSPTNERLRFYYVTLVFAALMYLVARRLVSSPVGRVMIAIRENEPRARMIGYNTFIYKLIAVTVSGLLAALAGFMFALWSSNANPSMLSATYTINALVMTIIGGVGTLVGPMIGAGVLQLTGYYLSDIFHDSAPLIFGIVFILIVMFFPYGLVGTWQLRGGQWRKVWVGRLRSLSAWRPGETDRL